MRRWILTAAVGAALGVSAMAPAQMNVDLTGFTARGGVVFPLDSDLREISDLWGGVGLDYTAPRSLLRGSDTYFSFDYIFRGTSGGNADIFPIAVNQRFYSGTGGGLMNGARRNYMFFGLGVAFLNVSDSSEMEFLVRGGVGTELGPNVIAEAIVTWTDRAGGNGARAAGVGVYLGYRF